MVGVAIVAVGSAGRTYPIDSDLVYGALTLTFMIDVVGVAQLQAAGMPRATGRVGVEVVVIAELAVTKAFVMRGDVLVVLSTLRTRVFHLVVDTYLTPCIATYGKPAQVHWAHVPVLTRTATIYQSRVAEAGAALVSGRARASSA